MDAREQAELAKRAADRLGYFRNTRREPGVTCAVCMTFTWNGVVLCDRCASDRAAFGAQLADHVGAMVYAGYWSTTGKVLENYKGRSGAVVESDRKAMSLLTVSTLWLTAAA